MLRKPKPKSLSKRDGSPQERGDIIQRFIQTRHELGITQAEFGEMLGISLSGIKQIENGYYAPSVDVIKKWSKRCSKSLDWIFWGYSQ